MGYSKLSEEEIEDALADLPGWELDEGTFHKTYEFEDFSEAMGWMVRVALEAEKIDHHPDWCNAWNEVDVHLHTHAIDALSQHDLKLAQKMEELARH